MNKKLRLSLAGILLVFIIGGFVYFKRADIFSLSGVQFAEAYMLVPDKVSKDAPIVISLPKGAAKEGAESKITFRPEIKGKWLTVDASDKIVFKPSATLELGKHYEVSLVTAQGTTTKDFLADVNPELLSVFPAVDSEAPENSAITFIFSRPMVPLTTLSELESRALPITITPPTKGGFKWISTRNLQFIPDNHLVRSANYKVTLAAGLTSVEGLAVVPFTHSFNTRPLRFLRATEGKIRYGEPLKLYFNQPVDLARTIKNITLTNNTTNKGQAFVAEYGERITYDDDGEVVKTEVDQAIINVWPKADRHGRAKKWDFNNNYTVELAKAYPAEGDIIYNERKTARIEVLNYLADVKVTSPRSSATDLDVFDPQGTAILTFSEAIDLKKSDISAKGLKSIVYEQKCKAEKGFFYRTDDDADCVKEDDQTKVILTFNPKALVLGQAVPIEFDKVIGVDGFKLNPSKEYFNDLKVYGPLKITKITPSNGANAASLTNLVICSNTPLVEKNTTNFKEAIKADNYLVFSRWDRAYRQQAGTSNPSCEVGEYVNRISYGLHPEKVYNLALHLVDDFGQAVDQKVSFTTAKPLGVYRRLHNLQKVYNVTTPDKTKLTYAAENMESVNLLLCQVDPGLMVGYMNQWEGGGGHSPDKYSCAQTARDVIDLPDNYWVNNYFQVDLKKYFPDPRGQYLLFLSYPGDLDRQGNQIYNTTIVGVTNLAVGEKKVVWNKYDVLSDKTAASAAKRAHPGNIYWINNYATLAPTVGATVNVYQSTDNGKTVKWAAQASANALGIAELPLVADVVGAVVTSGADSAIVSNWTDNLNYAGSLRSEDNVYLYTDRPIYRPGHKVEIKGIYRLNFDGDLQIFNERDLSIEVRNSKGDKVLEQKVAVNKYGTFATSLTLPLDAALGTYYMDAGGFGYAYFDVEEYVPAAFEASATVAKEEYIAGDEAKIDILAKYYFGVPVDGGEVDYSFTAQDYYFDRYTDEYFNFGGGWYYCYSCGFGDTYIGNGKLKLDTNGQAKLSQKLDFTKLFKGENGDSSKIVVFHGTVKDRQGRSVSFQKSFIVHRGEFYLGAKTDPSFVGVNQALNVKLKSVDVAGKPTGVSGLTMSVSRVEWQSFRRQEVDGGYYSRYERNLVPVSTVKMSTDGQGNRGEPLTLNKSGQYEIKISGRDGKGNDISTKAHVYVYGTETVSVEPTNNATLDLAVTTNQVKVGDRPEVIIQSPYSKAKALITIDRGGVLDYQVVDINQNFYKHQFTVAENYVPNVFVSVLLLSPKPEIKFGQVEFQVNQETRKLNIDIKPDKTSYLPGEKVVLNISTTNYLGQPVPAEVSVAVADLSVLALKGNPKKNPLAFFFSGLPLGVTTGSNIKNILEEVAIPTGTKGGDGGGAPDDLAKKKRGEFKDTAFWSAQTETDVAGRAQLSFTLPDNLTRWQIEAVGVTLDTKVGANYGEFTTQKSVMAIPLVPRFVVPGDELMIGAKVFNQTGQRQTLIVSVASPSLVIGGDRAKRVVIGANETETVYFSAVAPIAVGEGRHQFTLSAENKDFTDIVEQSIKITPNITYETTATAGSTKEGLAREYLYLPEGILTDRGEVTIKTNATLAVFLSDAIKYMADYPYGCSEQLASKLSTLAILKKGLAIENVGNKITIPPIEFDGETYTLDQAMKLGLDQIYNNQTVDGGFGYYQSLKPDLRLTLRVIGTLVDLKEAGVPVRQEVIDRAVNYSLDVLAKSDKWFGYPPYVEALYTLSRAGTPAGKLATLEGLVNKKLTNSFINEEADSNTLAYLALITSRGYLAGQQEKIFTALLNRVDIDSRGAYLKSGATDNENNYFSNPKTNTALLLKALAVTKRDYAETPNLLRWLLASRSKDGAWGSTNSTLAVIDAFTEYLNWQKETKADFSLDILLGENKVASADFNPKTVLDTATKILPIKQLPIGQITPLVFKQNNRSSTPSNFYYDISLKYFFPVEKTMPRDEGMFIERHFYRLTDLKREVPVTEAKVGEVLLGRLTFSTPKQRNLVSIEDYIPAGTELVNFNLSTEDRANLETPDQTEVPAENSEGDSEVKSDFYPSFTELRDDRLFLFSESLPPGTYSYDYYVRVTTPGSFGHLPAIISEMYTPENFGRTAGSLFKAVAP